LDLVVVFLFGGSQTTPDIAAITKADEQHRRYRSQ